MKRRVLAGLIILLIGMFPVWCHAQEEGDILRSGEWEYFLNEDGTVTISQWTGEEESLVIPEELDGRPVTVIGDGAFNIRSGLKEVMIPDSVTQIGDYAFWLCGDLENLTIPESVTRIGKMAFTACAMKRITIPDSVEEIGDWAFGSCHVLTQIEVSPGNENFTVMDHALIETKTMTLICYPEGLTDPEYSIPEGITRIGNNAFSYCVRLEHVTIPEGVTELGEHAFSSCRYLRDINLPQSIQKIGPYAFLECKRLTDIMIPESVTEIGTDAFTYCEDLTLTVREGSYAAKYAEENDVPCKKG